MIVILWLAINDWDHRTNLFWSVLADATIEVLALALLIVVTI